MEKHKAKFLGGIYKKKYYFVKYPAFVYNDFVLIEKKEIGSFELEKPPLKVGDNIHIHTIDKIVKVKKVVRSTDDGYLYETDYEFEVIEDEETLQSKIEAEKKLAEYNENIKEKENQEQKDDKKWYQFWK